MVEGGERRSKKYEVWKETDNVFKMAAENEGWPISGNVPFPSYSN